MGYDDSSFIFVVSNSAVIREKNNNFRTYELYKLLLIAGYQEFIADYQVLIVLQINNPSSLHSLISVFLKLFFKPIIPQICISQIHISQMCYFLQR